jgi:hypothetical protein
MSNSTTRRSDVTLSARNQMNVAVKDRLTSILASIQANIETRYFAVHRLNSALHFPQ